MSHVTWKPLFMSKGQRSGSPDRFGWLYWQANMDIELLVTDPDVCMMYIVSPLAGLGGGILWRPAAYSMFVMLLLLPLLGDPRSHRGSVYLDISWGFPLPKVSSSPNDSSSQWRPSLSIFWLWIYSHTKNVIRHEIHNNWLKIEWDKNFSFFCDRQY